MKKIISMALCLVFIVALVSCATKTPDSETPIAGRVDTSNKSDVFEVDRTQEAYDRNTTIEKSEAIQIKETEIDAINILESSFEEKGYEVSVEHVEPEILRGERYIIALSGISEARVTIYQYDNITMAKDDVLCIDKNGTTITFPDQTNYITWKSIPHYYYQDKAIIQYVGTDDTILSILIELYGEQFAGGTY